MQEDLSPLPCRLQAQRHDLQVGVLRRVDDDPRAAADVAQTSRQVERAVQAADLAVVELDARRLAGGTDADREDHLADVTQRASAALAGHDALVAQQLFNLTGRELCRVQDRILLLVKSAQERVASFLLEMAERVSGNSIDLPMSRQDIADYLGLTIETVSRTLTSLECAAAIEVPTSRRIVLRNRSALSRMNG